MGNADGGCTAMVLDLLTTKDFILLDDDDEDDDDDDATDARDEDAEVAQANMLCICIV
jgi:hypothetical protein